MTQRNVVRFVAAATRDRDKMISGRSLCVRPRQRHVDIPSAQMAAEVVTLGDLAQLVSRANRVGLPAIVPAASRQGVRRDIDVAMREDEM